MYTLKTCKVHIFWEGHKILRNLHLTFDWWRFPKILWPSQNIWTLITQIKISYGRCSDTPHVSFSWSSVVNQSPPITEGGWRPSCLVILRRFIGDFWSWILAISHDICQIIEMLNFTFFSSKFSWHLFTFFSNTLSSPVSQGP